MVNDIPDSIQSMIKDILANDDTIKKAKQLDKAKPAPVAEPAPKPKKQTKASIDAENDDDDADPNEEVEPVEPVKARKPKRITKKDRQNTLSKQYLEEVALGNLKFQDANGRNRTTTFKKWVEQNKNPKYDDEHNCWIIPDHEMYKQRVLAMKTCGSLFMKSTGCTLTQMQQAVSYFLKEIDEEQYENLAELLQTPQVSKEIIALMSKYNDKGSK